MQTGEPHLPPDPPLASPEAEQVRLLESLQIGVAVLGPAAEVAFANRAALEMLGLSAEQVLGRTALELGDLVVREDGSPFPPADHPAPRAIATGRSVRGVTMGFYNPARQERVWLLVNADPELAETGQVRSVVCTFVDVTLFKRAELRLQESETRYRRLVENAQDIIYGTDVNGFFTYVNPAASRLLGYPAQELVGTHFTELIHSDHRQRVADLLVRQFRDRVPTTYDEFPVVPSSGEQLWIGQNVQLLFTAGRVDGFQAVARDITERKRAQMALERERQQLRDIVTHAPVAMALLDRNLRYVAHSRKWSRLWGVDGRDLVGRAHAEVFPALAEHYTEAIGRALAGEVVSSPEDVLEMADGSRVYSRWVLHPWRDPDGSVAGVVTVVQNIDLLVRGRRAAEEASRMKSEFLANVSHELRTPLGQVIALSGLLQQTGLDAQQRQWLDLMRGAAGELLDRIDGILQFARLEEQPPDLRIEPFDPREVAQGLVASFAEAAAARGLELHCETAGLPARVAGDPGRLRQLLHQLVANAIKFTDAGSVRLRVRSSGPIEEPTLTFEVVDTGIGIGSEEQARLFEPFTQLDGSPSRRHGGTGLGLALARRLADALCGRLTVESEPGHGSTFAFTAPFEPVDEAWAESPLAPARSLPAAAGTAPPLVLVAEDNPINRKVVLAMLANLGYQAEAVNNGLEAVEACARTAYQAVLMDCMMPEMDGYRATAWIRQREAGKQRTPILALTASTAPGDREKCFAAGMDGYLSKPVSLRSLDETLRRWVRDRPQPVAAGAAETEGRSGLPAGHPLRLLEEQGRREAVIEIIDLFLHTTPLRLARLREVAEEGDVGGALSLAHSLRGAALQLGARDVARLCADAQAAARRGELQATSPLFERLEAAYHDVAAMLSEERTRLSAVVTSGPAAG
jgi:PAS domain S-box-containing protein